MDIEVEDSRGLVSPGSKKKRKILFSPTIERRTAYAEKKRK
jgi:hypothetical protein